MPGHTCNHVLYTYLHVPCNQVRNVPIDMKCEHAQSRVTSARAQVYSYIHGYRVREHKHENTLAVFTALLNLSLLRIA